MDGYMFKKCDIGHVFASGWRTSRDMVKRRLAFDSANRIGVSTISKGVLTVDQGVSGWRFKNRGIFNVFNY